MKKTFEKVINEREKNTYSKGGGGGTDTAKKETLRGKKGLGTPKEIRLLKHDIGNN